MDECSDPGACSQMCINEKGTFKCECHAGYARDPRDRTRCKATEGHPSLLFARRFDIRKISLDHHEMVAIVNDTKSATALDYVFRTGMIFWSDVTDEKIYKLVFFLYWIFIQHHHHSMGNGYGQDILTYSYFNI